MCFRYYHARAEPIQGKVLQPGWRRMMKSEPEGKIDDLFEALRKGRSVERNIGIFMVGLPAEEEVARSHFKDIGVQSAAYVYELAPDTEPFRHDWYWARELHARHPPLIGGRKMTFKTFRPDDAYVGTPDEEIVDRYWRNEPSGSPRWEFVVERATAVNCCIDPSTTP